MRTVRIRSLAMLAEDPFKYAFMLPTATAVATSCQLCGVGGAALFSPIFLLAFPLLGPEYPLDSSAAAIASALLTEVFGFASGLTGYSRRGLVSWQTAVQFAVVAVPLAFAGASCAGVLSADPVLLRGVYAALMFSLAAFLLFTPRSTLEAAADEECAIQDETTVRTHVTAASRVITFRAPAKGSLSSVCATGLGAFLTGLIGVGVGEVVLPQLVRSCCMPLPLAAGTSVAIVVATAASAALVQFGCLAVAAGGDIITVVPWDLVQFTIPGVLIGGQLAPLIASRELLSDDDIERFAAALFATVGTAFAIKSARG
eukprot:CAMPEP_0119317582 /NCGR_PEP_ID=MMETSP1333-20130426/43613_1 /TAXON_ID=418940 /ORGANISM="Scyphosphaera apsteinii, Strain RCC1455" /LENGTH=314 /DNA_ID=CAMNT_0007323559 /DNA_START=382 /DNA_END=1326 /DNA_ORIENTATION=-